MKSYLEQLNKEQFAAATDTEGPVLVLAGAGSGKTRVLTARIAYILDKGLCDPSQILAITFTNKAANEMRERVINFVGDSAAHMWISTIHSMCLRILRYSVGRLEGYNRNFTVYSEAEADRVIKRVISELNITGESVFKNAKYHISYAKTNDISPDRYLVEGNGGKLTDCVRIYKRYQEVLAESNAMDFDDLILKTYHLLAEDEVVRNYYAERFHYILIDEFQDTNFLQYEIAKLLSSAHGNIFAVGDDDQSIYGWRGAEIKNILNFDKDFKEAKVYKLQQNYRSTQNILQIANAVIRNNHERSVKTLWTENADGANVEYYCGDEEINEARYVVKKIIGIESRGGSYKDCAILMRINALSRSFEQELMRNNVPFKVFGGFKFFERKEIKDLTAYLRLIANPLDDDAFLRIINVPRRGIGDKTISQLTAYAAEHDISLFDALYEIEKINFSSSAKSKLDSFRQIISSLTVSSGTKPLNVLIDEVIRQTDFLSQFDAPTEENNSKKMNVNEFVSSVTEYCRFNKDGSLEDYLSSIALYSDIDEADTTDYVTIATIHAVKGLEFDTVFIVGCDETIFPVSRAEGSDADMEEERRLMYVAVTRARKKLFITRANSRYIYGNRQFTNRSRFVSEVASYLGISGTSGSTSFYRGSANSFGYGGGGYNTSSKNSSYRQYDRQNGRCNNQSDDDFGFTPDIPSESSATANYAKSFILGRQQTKTNATVKADSYSVGRMVRHKKFGMGKIIRVQPNGENTVIVVDFGEIGIKSLSVKFAPIELV